MNRPITPFILALMLAAAGCSNETGSKASAKPSRDGAQISVVAASARTDMFVERIEALGTTSANESVVITAEATGRVESINFDDGDFAEASAILVQLQTSQEQASLAAAAANLRTQKSQFERLQNLLKQNLIAQTTLDDQANILQAAEAQFEIARVNVANRTILAPFAGRLGIRRVSPGALVSPGVEIVTLDDLSTIKLDFSVPETYLDVLREGLEIETRSAAYRGRSFLGRVTVTASRVDPVTRTVVVRAELPNEENLLRPGMLMTVDLIQNRGETLLVPEESVFPVGEQQFVYRVENDDTVRRIPIKTGRRRPGEVEVLDGLAAGDRVVTEGITRIRAGMKVRVASGPDQSRVNHLDTLRRLPRRPG